MPHEVIKGPVVPTSVHEERTRLSWTLSSLGPRENEVARLAATGLSNKEIARVLDISIWTVAAHLRSIYGKLGVHRRSQILPLVLDGNNFHDART